MTYVGRGGPQPTHTTYREVCHVETLRPLTLNSSTAFPFREEADGEETYATLGKTMPELFSNLALHPKILMENQRQQAFGKRSKTENKTDRNGDNTRGRMVHSKKFLMKYT